MVPHQNPTNPYAQPPPPPQGGMMAYDPNDPFAQAPPPGGAGGVVAYDPNDPYAPQGGMVAHGDPYAQPRVGDRDGPELI